MDLQNILAYQAVDAQLFELENELANDPNKQKMTSLNQTAKASQTKSNQLEEQAGQILREMEELNKTLELSRKKGEQVLSASTENLTIEEIDERVGLKDKVSQNLTLLDKKLTKLAESINGVLAEFNRTIKNYKPLMIKTQLLLSQKSTSLKQNFKQCKKALTQKLCKHILQKERIKFSQCLLNLTAQTVEDAEWNFQLQQSVSSRKIKFCSANIAEE